MICSVMPAHYYYDYVSTFNWTLTEIRTATGEVLFLCRYSYNNSLTRASPCANVTNVALLVTELVTIGLHMM